MSFREGSAKNSEILRKYKDGTTMNCAASSDDAIAWKFLSFHAEISASVFYESACFEEGTGIYKGRDALPGRELAFLVLFLNAFGAASNERGFFGLFDLVPFRVGDVRGEVLEV